MGQTILCLENSHLIYRKQPADIAGNAESNDVDSLRSEVSALKETVALNTKRVEELERPRTVEITDLSQDGSFITIVSVFDIFLFSLQNCSNWFSQNFDLFKCSLFCYLNVLKN